VLSDFNFVKPGMSWDEIVEKIGEPDRTYGHGLLYAEYDLVDRRTVRLIFRHPDELAEAKVCDQNEVCVGLTQTRILRTAPALVIALVAGPWLTLSALRLIREPVRKEDSSLFGRIIGMCAANHFLAHDDVRFWAWLFLVMGIGFDLIASYALIVIARTLL
jgi:hypothetical protein